MRPHHQLRIRELTLAPCLLLALLLLALPKTARAEECPNAAFRTGPSAALPDCRAYELVTPAFKNGGVVERSFEFLLNPESPNFVATPGLEGESVPFHSRAAFAGAENNLSFTFVNYISDRTATGWQTRAQDPSAERFLPDQVQGLSSDQQTGLWLMRPVSQGENTMNFYLLGLDGSVVEVGPGLPPSSPVVPEFGPGIHTDGVSADLSHVVFHDLQGAWPFAPAGALLEYEGTGNTEPMPVGVGENGGFADECSAQELGGQTSSGEPNAENAVSANGETIFFTDDCGRELYARVDNGQAGARTVAISEPTAADCATCDTEPAVRRPAYYLGASEDGSKVFFATAQPLLGSDPSVNLYEYDFDAPAGERLVKVSAGDESVSNPTAEVLGALQVSPDGSHIYFAATGVLTTSPNYAGDVAQAGQDNVYVYEHDASYPNGRITFVAALPGESHLWAYSVLFRHRRGGSIITPDGRFLVFESPIHLTADDAASGRQLFEYDAQTSQMRRVSVGQDGFNDNGNTASVGEHFNVSNDGSFVFFESSAGLTPQALNYDMVATSTQGQPVYANNIYEYHEGGVSLISDGHDVAAFGNAASGEGGGVVELIGAGASGRDVYFTTADRLVGQDTDTQVDIYDARIDGGFPGPPSPVECQADACQGPLSSAPVLLTAGSELQAGGEDVASGPPAAPATKTKAKHAKAKHRRKKHDAKRASSSRSRGVRRGK